MDWLFGRVRRLWKGGGRLREIESVRRGIEWLTKENDVWKQQEAIEIGVADDDWRDIRALLDLGLQTPLIYTS